MDPNLNPPWRQGWEPAPPPPPKPTPGPPGNPKWVKGMKSPNPAGRPPGSTAQTILLKRMQENADGILDVIIAKALAGDSNSASLILSRVTPSLKAVARPVEFDFDPDAPVSRQVEMVIAAIADGSMPADIGRQVIDAISNLGSLRMQEDLEARIVALEEARDARA